VSMSLNARVRVNDGVLFQELQGEAVLLHLDSGMYFGLDSVGTRMWQLIVAHEGLGEVARAILAEFEVSEEQCTSDLLNLVAKLEERNLITVTR
jgi:hypothetical protein